MQALRLRSTSRLHWNQGKLRRQRRRNKTRINGGGKHLKNRDCIGRIGLIVVSAFLLIGLSACNRNSSGGDVMASVNGRKIYRTEVDKYYSNQTSGSDKQPTGEQAVSLRLSILNELVETEILMQRAEKLGLLATDEEVDRKLNEIKSPYHCRRI